MDISRRNMLRSALASSSAAAAAAPSAGDQATPVNELKIARTTQTKSVCPYCAVGCSVVIHTLGDKARNVKPAVVHIEGDPDSPINRGTLCPKGIGLKEFVASDRRLTKPLYRARGASEWSEISWEDAIPKMARLIKDSRDRGFEEKDAQGRTVNRLANTALIGGCTDTNEVNFLLSRFRFGLGILPYENQSRL
jgi:formate dehydrogenase major subunit